MGQGTNEGHKVPDEPSAPRRSPPGSGAKVNQVAAQHSSLSSERAHGDLSSGKGKEDRTAAGWEEGMRHSRQHAQTRGRPV